MNSWFQMLEKFKLDDIEYAKSDLSDNGRSALEQLIYIEFRMAQANNNIAILNKAKNAYIQDLSSEVLELKTGISFENLFSDN